MVFLPCRERIAMLCQRTDLEGRRMVLSFSRDVGAAERARGVNRPSLCWIRSWCCSMLLSGSACPHFFQKLSRVYRGGKVNVTVQRVTSHFISRCILLSRSYDLICHKHSDDLR